MKHLNTFFDFIKSLFIIIVLCWVSIVIGINSFPDENNILMGISVVIAIIVALKFDAFSKKYFKY